MVINMDFNKAHDKLAKYGQEHVLKYYNELSQESKDALLGQIADTDFSVTANVTGGIKESPRGVITPIKVMTLDEINAGRENFVKAGLEIIRAGKAGAVLLAGGMGTRLGSDNPKGMYDIGITKPVYIFQRIIRNLLDVVDMAGTWIHLFRRKIISHITRIIYTFLNRIWHLLPHTAEKFIWKPKTR